MAAVAHSWRPISDLDDDAAALASDELAALGNVWSEQRKLLTDAQLHTFNERLQREWAIETGVIENVYTISTGVTQLLIARGLEAALIPHGETDKDPELVAQILKDQKAALDGLFDFVRNERALSTGYIKEMHALLTRHQDTTSGVDFYGRRREVSLLHGAYKEWPNNPTRQDGSVHEYCPPEHVPSEMDRLVVWHLAHDQRGVPSDVQSAWLHHRFTQIHPFQDGNGRVARLLASLVFIQAGWFPLTILRGDERERYITALEQADDGDLSPLVAVFADVQKRAFRRSLAIADEVSRRDREIGQVIEALRDDVRREEEQRRAEWERAKVTAAALLEDAWTFLERTRDRLQAELGRYVPDYSFHTNVERPGGQRGHYLKQQIILTARDLDYFANTASFTAWARLMLRTATQAEILVSFHGIGTEWRGIIGVSACFYRKVETEDGPRDVVDLTTLVDDVFQINYVESQDQTARRFARWLDHAVIAGLETWRSRRSS